MEDYRRQGLGLSSIRLVAFLTVLLFSLSAEAKTSSGGSWRNSSGGRGPASIGGDSSQRAPASTAQKQKDPWYHVVPLNRDVDTGMMKGPGVKTHRHPMDSRPRVMSDKELNWYFAKARMTNDIKGWDRLDKDMFLHRLFNRPTHVVSHKYSISLQKLERLKAIFRAKRK